MEGQAVHLQGPEMSSSQAPLHPRKLPPEPAPSSFLKWISHPGITKMSLSSGKGEQLLPEHSGFCSFKSPCVGRRRVDWAGGGFGGGNASHSGAHFGVDALGRAGIASNSLLLAHWFIPQISAERLRYAGDSRKHFRFIISRNSCPQPGKRSNPINPILQMRKLRLNDIKPGCKVTRLMNNTGSQRKGN